MHTHGEEPRIVKGRNIMKRTRAELIKTDSDFFESWSLKPQFSIRYQRAERGLPSGDPARGPGNREINKYQVE
jgi:hypothetical protein